MAWINAFFSHQLALKPTDFPLGREMLTYKCAPTGTCFYIILRKHSEYFFILVNIKPFFLLPFCNKSLSAKRFSFRRERMRAYLPTELIFNLILLWPLALIVLYNTSRLFYAAIDSTVTLVILIVLLSIFSKGIWQYTCVFNFSSGS